MMNPRSLFVNGASFAGVMKSIKTYVQLGHATAVVVVWVLAKGFVVGSAVNLALLSMMITTCSRRMIWWSKIAVAAASAVTLLRKVRWIKSKKLMKQPAVKDVASSSKTAVKQLL
jgi:hypothetical protein